jgi:hypothetical protein
VAALPAIVSQPQTSPVDRRVRDRQCRQADGKLGVEMSHV